MRTYRTLSLSLPPEVVASLDRQGKAMGITAARVAANLVLQHHGSDDWKVRLVAELEKGRVALSNLRASFDTIDTIGGTLNRKTRSRGGK